MPSRQIARLLLLVAGISLFVTVAGVAAGSDAEPRFTESNELIRPEGYREWIFVGASLGMSYQENPYKRDHPKFHNVYINPSSYREYNRTGRFPEKTILVMEVLTAASQSSINRQGQFQGEFVGVEAAVKDSSRFPEGWAYFNFSVPDGPPAGTAPAFAKERCWSCHSEHAATDNVFTQFYPVLRREK